MVELQANREALGTRQGLARLLSREGGKEAVGDRPVTRDPLRDEAWRTDWAIEALARDSRPGDVDVALLRAWREQQEQLAGHGDDRDHHDHLRQPPPFETTPR